MFMMTVKTCVEIQMDTEQIKTYCLLNECKGFVGNLSVLIATACQVPISLQNVCKDIHHQVSTYNIYLTRVLRVWSVSVI